MAIAGLEGVEIDGETFLEGPDGEIAETSQDAYNLDFAKRQELFGGDDTTARSSFKFIQDFLSKMGDEKDANKEVEGARIKVSTGTLEDWLWRGTHPILKDLS